MFKLIKKLAGQNDPAPVSQPVRSRPKPRRDYSLSVPMPLPEAIESSWDEWQDSVDSQMMPFAAGAREFAPTTPSQLDEIDPFQSVKSRDA
jgi:hypothetical protein